MFVENIFENASLSLPFSSSAIYCRLRLWILYDISLLVISIHFDLLRYKLTNYFDIANLCIVRQSDLIPAAGISIDSIYFALLFCAWKCLIIIVLFL